MLQVVGIILFAILLLTVIGFFFFYAVGFIRPAAVQIQLFGIHLTLFGGILLMIGSTGTGFFIMLLGLALGVFGSFKSEDSTNPEAESKKAD
ncbi:hypothetical protein F9U64_20175 [Gracilibacillus oryzae]|uniref:Uncharacterized protein n=1 Tax=Gracilibacillus oryzae TaxID=1672701 RepID=A0A7C8GQW1_9BACI|nr:hypothetical protein [Gracilibacillus oryzae]KAB8126380.1 hypothetical protein F9U64_20175 [Gracilibacillus oryzae]